MTIAALLGAIALAPASASAAAPTVLSTTKSGPVSIPATQKTVATLQLPAGGWLVMVKAQLAGVGGSGGQHLGVDCRLVAGSRSDMVSAAPSLAGSDGSRVSFLLTLATRIGSPGQARLRCVGEVGGAVRVGDIILTAIRAGTLTTRDTVAPARTTGSGTPRIISARGKGTTNVPGDNAYHTVGIVDIPVGAWWVIAKAVAAQGPTSDQGQCRLAAGGDFDLLRFPLSTPVWAGDTLPIALQVVHAFESPGIAVLECKGPQAFDISRVVISAVKAGRLTNRPLAGGTSWTVGSGSPRVISGWSDGPAAVPHDVAYATVSSLSLPRGRWIILVKQWFEGVSVPSDANLRKAQCRLVMSGVQDRSEIRYRNNVSRIGPLVMLAVQRSTGGTAAQVQCRRTAEGGTGVAVFIKTTALRTR